MDLFKLIEFCKDTIDLLDRIVTDTNDAIEDLNKRIENLERTINNSAGNSAEHVNRKVKEYTKQITKSAKKLQNRVNEKIEDAKVGYNKKANDIKINIIKSAQSSLGLNLPNELIKNLADAIPTPDPGFPTIEIQIPEINELNTETNISFGRIPLIPWSDKLDNTSENIDAIEKTAKKYKKEEE